MTTTAKFKTTLMLCMPVSILEQEIDRRRGKRSRSEFSSVILEARVLTDQEKIIMTSVVPSGSSKATNRDPQTANATEDFTTPTTTTKQPKEVEAIS